VSSKSTIIAEFISLRDAAVRIVFSIFTIREKVDGGELPAYRISDKLEARSRS
jgi:hypothetical protein